MKNKIIWLIIILLIITHFVLEYSVDRKSQQVTDKDVQEVVKVVEESRILTEYLFFILVDAPDAEKLLNENVSENVKRCIDAKLVYDRILQKWYKKIESNK